MALEQETSLAFGRPTLPEQILRNCSSPTHVAPRGGCRSIERCAMTGHVGDLSPCKAHRITEDLGRAQSRNFSFTPNKKKNCKNLGGKLLNLHLFHVSAHTGQQHIRPSL